MDELDMQLTFSEKGHSVGRLPESALIRAASPKFPRSQVNRMAVAALDTGKASNMCYHHIFSSSSLNRRVLDLMQA